MTQFALEHELSRVTLLVTPGRYAASLGDLELPDGMQLDIVGNVESRPAGKLSTSEEAVTMGFLFQCGRVTFFCFEWNTR